MTPEELDDVFDQFDVSTFRLETLQRYSVSAEDARMRAFREGNSTARAIRTHQPLVAPCSGHHRGWEIMEPGPSR